MKRIVRVPLSKVMAAQLLVEMRDADGEPVPTHIRRLAEGRIVGYEHAGTVAPRHAITTDPLAKGAAEDSTLVDADGNGYWAPAYA